MTDDEDASAPGDARPWLKKLKHAEKAFETYQQKCDSIEKLSGNLERLSSNTGDKEFQIFWANLEVLKPSIYERAPVPVVMPRHSDLGQVVRKASEMMERALQYDVEADDLHDTLQHVRDDLATCARGVPWVLDNGQCIHVERQDFLHEPARKWSEVQWVARAVYVTKDEGRERFGDIFRDVQAKKIGSTREGDDYEETEDKVKVWEIWSKADRRVLYVTEGVEQVLEQSDPFIDVKGFFPCPRPAYGTVQPGTLLPVPDFVYYRDQVDEINTLTRRITALTESLRLKGFYASGTSEVGEAIEASMRQSSDKAILVPISNFAALGGTALRDSIVWLPVREVSQMITDLVMLRKQLIDDVYEITGLSDIMRGQTEKDETATAQNLKAQYGSVRIRDRQGEMVRIAADILKIKAEIFAETMPVAEIAQMAAMPVPTMAEIQAQMAQMQAPPTEQPVALEQIEQLFKAQRIRPFLLDVETDSTIAPNEEAEKRSRIEFLQAMGQFMREAGQAVQVQPATAPFLGELMKFAAGGFRAGRDLGGEIDNFVEQVKAQAAQALQGQDQNPEAQAAMAQAQAEQAKAQMDAQIKQAEMQAKMQEAQGKMALDRQKAQVDAQLRQMEVQVNAALKRMELDLKRMELGVKADDQLLKERQAEIDTLLKMEEVELEREQRRAVKLGNEG